MSYGTIEMLCGHKENVEKNLCVYYCELTTTYCWVDGVGEQVMEQQQQKREQNVSFPTHRDLELPNVQPENLIDRFLHKI